MRTTVARSSLEKPTQSEREGGVILDEQDGAHDVKKVGDGGPHAPLPTRFRTSSHVVRFRVAMLGGTQIVRHSSPHHRFA